MGLLSFFKLEDNYIGYNVENSLEKLSLKYVCSIKVDKFLIQQAQKKN